MGSFAGWVPNKVSCRKITSASKKIVQRGYKMKVIVDRYRLRIIPDDADCRDEAYIEEVLGLTKPGDSIKLTRKNVIGMTRIAYLETEED